MINSDYKGEKLLKSVNRNQNLAIACLKKFTRELNWTSIGNKYMYVIVLSLTQ